MMRQALTKNLSLLLVSFSLVGVAACSAGKSAPKAAAELIQGSNPDAPAYASGVRMPSANPSERERVVKDFYLNVWKKKYLRQGCGGYYVLSSGGVGENVGDTLSEAHGYGMMILPLMAAYDPNAQTAFDGMVNFFLKFRNENGLMNWTIDVAGACRIPEGASDSATDGDLDIAYGLLLADKIWGSNGVHPYRELGLALVKSIASANINSTSHVPLLGDWAADSAGFKAGTRSSDFMTGHFKVFARLSNNEEWKRVTESVYFVINTVQEKYSRATGLLPDFIVYSSTVPKPAPADYLEANTDGEYSYNACRFPWRLAADYVMTGDPRARQALSTINQWVRMMSKGDPSRIHDGYKLSGSKGSAQSGPSMAFTAPFAAAAMAGDDQTFLDALWSFVSAGSSEGYYEDSVRMLNLLLLSGQWQSP